VISEKYKRVSAYATSIVQEVETIAHSVGVSEPREMRRRHVRIVEEGGRSRLMSDIQPSYKTLAKT